MDVIQIIDGKEYGNRMPPNYVSEGCPVGYVRKVEPPKGNSKINKPMTKTNKITIKASGNNGGSNCIEGGFGGTGCKYEGIDYSSIQLKDKPMKTNEQLEWKNKFREEFCHTTRIGLDLDLDNFSILKLEQFIKDLLSVQKKTLIERVEKPSEVRKAKPADELEKGYDAGYDDKRDEVLKIIKDL